MVVMVGTNKEVCLVLQLMCDEDEQKSQRLKQFEQKLGETRKQHGERLSGWW